MSLTLGPLLFATPLALLALLGLPLLWFVLRATPPQPKMQVLPSFALFEDMGMKEETPDDTPWWIIALRILIVSLAILGLASPIWSPPKNETGVDSNRDVLLIIDNGWTAAPNWSASQSAALGTLAGLDRDRAVFVLPTTSTDYTEALANRLSPQAARSQVQALRPNGWQPDYTPLAEALEGISSSDFRTVWISDGQRSEGLDSLNTELGRIGPVDVVPLTEAPLVAISTLSTTARGPALTLIRSEDDGDASVSISAYDESGSSVASARGSFADGETITQIAFEVPEAIQSAMNWFTLSGASSAAGVWQWEGADRVRRVGLLSEGQNLQPLLSDTYYVRKALAPFANIVEGTIGELLDDELNVIILTDVGELAPSDETRLREWIEAGGVLVRFAGPRLAAQADSLLPVRLRRASRALDSALSWDTPQALNTFSETGPFANISIDREVLIRRQVLAQPDPELASRTWARLADGTPLVTSDILGDGRLTLFHVTAGPEWSDLPLAGVFVEMLRRATLPARDLGQASVQPNTSLAPQRWLNGYGDFISPPPNAEPIQVTDAIDLQPTAQHPAGLYKGSAVTLTINAGAGWEPDPMTSWPSGFAVRTADDQATRQLSGWFLGLAALLLLADLIISLFLAGRLRFGASAGALIIGMMAGGLMLVPPQSHAQEETIDTAAMEAALDLRFGYILTDDSATNRKAEAGLRGLSIMLYRRTTVEPQEPVGLNLSNAPLSIYPFILIAMPPNGMELDNDERSALAQYLRNGGALLIDTGTGGTGTRMASDERLALLLEGLDIPPLVPAHDDHVLTRSFYLLDSFTGRFIDRPIWIESGANSEGDERRGDGISSIFITDADMASAWALDENGRPLFSVDGGQRNREQAFRSGINLIMYVLTGNYKEDQVHLPSLLERLGEVTDTRNGEDRVRDVIRSPEDAQPRDLTTEPEGDD
ncbi:MAG: hypothetical protein CMK09_03840 [Ponticaulis sp.]|nr:hypothetical protein [Ponticaulis sp.]